MIEAYPLSWPTGYKRTNNRIRSKFKQSYDRAQNFLRDELLRLGAKKIVVSTNLRVRQDGLLYAGEMNRRIDDPGVAVYFEYDGQQNSLCCDQYEKIWENIYAIGVTVQSLRTIDRHGVSEFLKRAFTGFQALPEAASAECNIWDVLGLAVMPESVEAVKSAFRERAKECHPDSRTGSTEAFQELNSAYHLALNFYQ